MTYLVIDLSTQKWDITTTAKYWRHGANHRLVFRVCLNSTNLPTIERNKRWIRTKFDIWINKLLHRWFSCNQATKASDLTASNSPRPDGYSTHGGIDIRVCVIGIYVLVFYHLVHRIVVVVVCLLPVALPIGWEWYTCDLNVGHIVLTRFCVQHPVRPCGLPYNCWM